MYCFRVSSRVRALRHYVSTRTAPPTEWHVVIRLGGAIHAGGVGWAGPISVCIVTARCGLLDGFSSLVSQRAVNHKVADVATVIAATSRRLKRRLLAIRLWVRRRLHRLLRVLRWLIGLLLLIALLWLIRLLVLRLLVAPVRRLEFWLRHLRRRLIVLRPVIRSILLRRCLSWFLPRSESCLQLQVLLNSCLLYTSDAADE